METTSYLLTQIGFGAVTLVFYGWALGTLRKGLAASTFSEDRKRKIFVRTLVSLVVWMAFVSILSIRGFFSDFTGFPPKIGIVLVIPMVVILLVTFSKTTREILSHISATDIIRIQVFRVFVEVLLWMLLVQNLMPVQMSFEGRNFDILSGLTAPLIAYLVSRNRIGKKWVVIWNLFGLILLFNIVAIAVLSMPTPMRVFMNEPSNTIVTRFPIIWLPALLVPLAYGLHFLSLRQVTLSVQGSKSKVQS